jgi:hypothetical protein
MPAQETLRVADPRSIVSPDGLVPLGSLVVRRFGLGDAQPVQFGGFDGLGEALLAGLEAVEFLALGDDDFVELLDEPFEVREVRFEAGQPLGGVVVHGAQDSQPGAGGKAGREVPVSQGVRPDG